jgi:MSHA biogenesis protein MshQ
VNSGTLTGAVSLSPAASGVSYSPTTFSLGSANTIQDILLQATAASAGTYTLFATGLSKLPLNGTRCVVGGVLQPSCQITIANTPCVANFECMETGRTYNNPVTPINRNPLYTKLAATGFRFDVLALQASGAVATAYTGNVSVELIDDSANPVCSVPTAISSQSLTFAAVDNGRKTLAANFTLPDAYKDLRCRVRETSATSPITACSSDRFTVRPQSFISIVSSANADNGGTSISNTPTIAAGGNFTLTANTATNGYDGLPKINPALLQWSNAPPVLSGGKAPPGTGVLSGMFTIPANTTNGNGASGTAFQYDEVGYFRFLQNGVYDDLFVVNSGSADVSNGDCIVGGFSNTADTSANPLLNGRFGCNFGNPSISNHFGRFIPHHFRISENTLAEACPMPSPNTAFSYFGQDGFVTNFKLTAENSSNGPTRNYSGSFAKLNLANYPSYNFSMSGAPVGANLTVSSTAPTGSWFGGEATVAVKHQISRPTALANQTTIGILAAPTDGEVAISAPFTTGTTLQRYGRMRLQSAYGSEMLDLPVPFFAEYRNNNVWLKNTDDSCTPITAPAVGSGLIFYPDSSTNHLVVGETVASVSGTGKLVAGDSQLKFSKPGLGNSGYLDLNIPVSTWLQFPWRGGATAINPTAKVKFGSYKKANQFIYMREIH